MRKTLNKKNLKMLFLLVVISMSICICEKENLADDTKTSTQDICWNQLYDYSEGLAWVKFATGKVENELNTYKQHFFGAINKQGEMIFRIQYESTDLVSVTNYSNGYAYVTHTDRLDVVNSIGEIVASYSKDENKNVRAYGDGYVLMEEHYADFDSNGYVYTIYSPNGDVIQTIDTDNYSNFVRYLGKGVFLCNGNLYFSKNGAIMDVNDDSDYHQYYFYEDTAAFGIDYYEPDIDGGRGKLKLITSDGRKKEVELGAEYGWIWDDDVLAVKNGICIIYDYENTLIAYNLNDGSFKTMPEEYSNKIDWESINSHLFFDSTGRIALPAKGSDDNYYVLLFDTDWNMIGNPIQIMYPVSSTEGFAFHYQCYDYSENRLITTTLGLTDNMEINVYDENENPMYELVGKGFYGITPYSDGAAGVSSYDYYKKTGLSVYQYDVDGSKYLRLDEGESPKYLGLDGNLLFEEINMDSVIER